VSKAFEPDYLRLNEVAELLECEPHHVKDLVALGRLRCGVRAQGWWGHAMPPYRAQGAAWDVAIVDTSADDRNDKTFHVSDPKTLESFFVRTARVAQFWYLTHGDAYRLCAPGCDEVEAFFLEPAPGVGEQLHNDDPERWPWPDFIFWPFADQEPPVRATWQDILFLRGDVEALSSTREVLGDAERARLLKTIAVMASMLAEKGPKYKAGDRPNALQIAEKLVETLDAMPDANNRRGLGLSSVRAAITEGLELLKK
jgi:hypothetical protein